MVGLKRRIIMLLIISYLLSLSFFNGSRWFAKAQPKTWIVGTVDEERPVDFKSIQAAVNNASSGDTIFVYKGIYYENIEVSKPNIALVGEDRDLTIINGTGGDVIISIRADRVTVTGFTIRKTAIGASGIGIQVVSGNNVIKGNTIEGIQEGILVYSYGDNTISDNILRWNTNTGINLYLSINNLVTANMLSNNSVGVSLSLSGSNMFSENTISNNSVGVFVSPNSNNNSFYHNNFVDNGNQAMTSGSINIWDYRGEGNYWSTYRGNDPNRDGIGEFAYGIDVANRDSKPLMGMFFNFTAKLARETFVVSTISNSTVTDFRFETGSETGNQMLLFNVDGEDGTTGFCRVAIPVRLMNYTLVLVGSEEIEPNVVTNSDKENTYLYFAYEQSRQTVAIISSKMVNMYNELLNQYYMLQNILQDYLADLNSTYLGLLADYTALVESYSQLQQEYNLLNSSYYEHLRDYDESLENTRNLMYIFAGAAGVLIVATVYMSKRANTHPPKTDEEKR